MKMAKFAFIRLCVLLEIVFLAHNSATLAFVSKLSSARVRPSHSAQGRATSATTTTQLASQNVKYVNDGSRGRRASSKPAASSSSIRSAYISALPSRKPVLSWESISQGYSQLTQEHYLPMAFGQAAVLASTADIMTQTMEAGNIQWAHVAAMAAVASTWSGALNAVWLRQLEDAFPGTQPTAVATKTVIHATIVAGLINSAYLAGVPLLKEAFGHGVADLATKAVQHPSSLLSGWSLDEFITLTKLELLMFVPYNTVAFKFIPPSIRPLTHATVSATFNVAVSAVTLGYFTTWCERAMGIFHS